VDPALWELLRAEDGADGDRVLEAIIRFARPGIEIPGVRIVSRFGAIATCRIRARDVIPVRARDEVKSVKAALRLSAGFEPGAASPDLAGPAWPGECATDVRRSPALGLTGAGVVVAAVDWGVDVDSAAFRWPDEPAAADAGHEAGGTRLVSFWDQRDQAVGPRPDPYGYGTVHSREEIDRALRDPRPYERLGYHPAIADRSGRGSHGTRTLDIAAGNGRGGGPTGIAPDADLVFVHLADRNTGGLANFGDSVRLLEAVDFISRTAGAQPCVINISAGRICGPKDGTTLVERAFDELLAATPGRFVINSAGNYFGWRAHSCGTIAPGEVHSLSFAVAPTDITANELEIWYDGADEFTVRIEPPGYTGGRPVGLGERSDLLIDGRVIGHVYHRKRDPNNCDNHIVAYLDPVGRAGNWTVTLEGRRVSSGRYHAWIERDDTCPGCQARFTHDDSNPATTIGSIATSHLPLIVGAYDGHDPARPVAAFSSAGPGRDGRCLLPNLVAPGVDVLTARSAPVGASRSPGLLTRGNGTSFAAPHVTGAVALCFEAAGHRLSADKVRSLVLGSCDPVAEPGPECRLGYGYLNIPRLIADTQQALAAPATPGAEEPTVDTDDTIALLAAAPAIAYREYLYRPNGDLARWISDHYDVVARPGQRVGRAPQEGDVLLEVTLGHLSGGRCTALAAGDLGLVASRPMPPGHLLLRPRRQVETSEPLPVEPAYGVPGSGSRPGEQLDGDAEFGEAARHSGESSKDDCPPDLGPWTGTAEQENFRARVLAEHIALSRKAKGAPQRDLREDELSDIPGTCRTEHSKTTCVRTLPATAEAAGRLLQAANADLQVAQQAGDADAQRTVKLSATSGYRGSGYQERLWLGYFASKYYDKSCQARARIPDGPHSEAAVDYMLKPQRDGGYGIPGKIAAPGYSNHQGGIAVDFWQDRTKGHGVGNESDDPSRCRWRESWFHGWLRTHAAAYGFRPIDTEEWHWEYRPAVKAPSDPAGYRGGKLWTFASAAHPQPVAVFCPKAALGRTDVDVLVFAHGLLGGCRRPGPLPAGFVTGAPFELGRIVDVSGRPAVLVVPLLDWANPCGEVVFGPGRKRWHPLGQPARLNAVVSEVLAEVGRVQGTAAPSLRELIVAGHSRAYDVLEPLAASRADPAMRQGALARLSQVWAFDTTYAGDVSAWTDWLKLNPSLQLHLYYRPVKTKKIDTQTVGDRFYDVRSDRLIVTKVAEEHCDVPATRLAELMPKPAAPAAEPGEEKPYGDVYGDELEPFGELGDLHGPVGDTGEAIAAGQGAWAALDPDLSASLGLKDPDVGSGEGLDDSDDEIIS
jgi:subtilisin family serine protease